MQEIIISSFNKSSGTPENFQIPFNYKGTRIKLLEAAIPMSYNNINTGSFSVTGNATGVFNITVPGDRYTLQTLAEYLQTEFNAAVIGQSYMVTANAAGQLIISATEQFSLNFTTSTLNIGFSGITPAANIVKGNSILSVLQVASHILICSQNIRGIDNGPNIAGTGVHNILHAVPLCGSGITNYRASTKAPWIKLTQPITGFYLAFPNGFPVNLNGADYAFKILINI